MAPFGFTPDDGQEEPDELSAMMRQMQEQIKEQFEKLGMNTAGFVNPFTAFTGGAADVLPQSIVRDTAKKFTAAQGSQPIGTKDLTVVHSAIEISDLWLNQATDFPATSPGTSQQAISRLDWIDLTLAGWQETMEPLAAGLASAISNLLDSAMESPGMESSGMESSSTEGAQPPIGAISSLLRTFIGSMIATQLGQAIGGLSATATGTHDIGLPLLDPACAVLIPENIEVWSKDLEIDKSQVYIFHALREGAIARLFAHNPWLVSYIRSAIVDYGRGIRIDLEAIQRQAEEAMQGVDLANLDPANPETFSLALNSGIFTPDETPEQKAALSKLETALALVDGWADDVTTLAAGDRLPAINLLRETYRRNRATAAPAQQLFKTLLGLEVSPKLAREASHFWQQIRELKDIAARDRIWSSALPTSDELLNPAAFLTSTQIPDDLSGLL